MSTVPVLYSFARSGGTLVNQLLGVHPRCLVLSEVNPAASYKSVAEQAVEWLRLVRADEAPRFGERPYREQIAVLAERAGGGGKRLVVRDWVTVNFLPGASRDHTVPSGQLEQDLYLRRAGLEPLPLVVSRRGADVYRSIARSFPHLRELEIDVFAKSYLAYARGVAAFPKVHLEDLRSDPPAALGEILRRFELDGADRDSLLRTFHEFHECTGNTTLEARSASASATRILPPDPAGREAAALHPALVEADRMLGYA